ASFRDFIYEDDKHIENILFILQVYVSQNIRLQSISLLVKLSAGRAENKILNAIVNAGGTRIILQSLCVEFAETDSNEELMIVIHKLLYKLAPYDPRFTLRVKLSQCIPITVSLLRIQMANIHSFMSQSSHSSISIPKIPYSTPNFCIHQPTSNRSDNRRSSFNVPRLPTSLTNKISILLKTILCYCLRGGRSNAATLGRLGAINLLFKALATVSGLSINYSGVSSASDETMNRMAVVEKCTRNGLKMIANFSTVQKVLVTMTAIIKWRHNVTRAVNAGGVSLLLDLLLVLHRCDNERLVNLQLITITALQTITELRAGRCALVAAGGLFSLSTLCASKISAVKQSSSYPASIVSDHFIHQTTCTTINNPPVKQSTSPEATESLDRQWKFSATLSGNSSVSSGNFSGESTPQVHTMSSTSNDSRLKRQRLAKNMESVMNGVCDLLRRCCPYIPLPVIHPEPILKVLFNEG
ncbi:unnamed protein product, partial [Hymenolepis diminuta]